MTSTIIRQVCHRVLAQDKYLMKDGTTWCNYALHDILSALGLSDFVYDKAAGRPLLANDICEKLETTCPKLTYAEAFEAARAGSIVVAALREPCHGHVALVYPFPGMYTSGKWKRSDLPCVANVGKENGVMPLNWAFGATPQIYLVKDYDQ